MKKRTIHSSDSENNIKNQNNNNNNNKNKKNRQNYRSMKLKNRLILISLTTILTLFLSYFFIVKPKDNSINIEEETLKKDNKLTKTNQGNKQFLNNNNNSKTMMGMDDTNNIIIVGSGLAGLTSVIEAYHTAKKLYVESSQTFPTFYLVEKERGIGGNSAKATSGMNGALTAYQKQAGIVDSLETFTEDTLRSGGNLNVPPLVNALVHDSKDILEWLRQFNLTLSAISQCGGHSVPRTHRQPPRADGKPSPVGWNIISALKTYITTQLTDHVNILFNSRVTELVMEDDANSQNESRVIGINYTQTIKGVDGQPDQTNDLYLPAKAVILASGGYAHDWTDSSLLRRFGKTSLANVPTTNGPFATGDGVKMGTALGAAVVDMDKIQIHPTGFIKLADPFNPTKFLAPEALRGYGGILLNDQGDRYVNELSTRDKVSEAIFKNCSNVHIKHVDAKSGAEEEKEMVRSWLIMNEEGAKAFDIGSINFYVKMGLIHIIDGLSGVAELTKIPETKLKETLDKYNTASEKGEDEFGKKRFPTLFTSEDKFYVASITPSIHYTMGGLAVNAVGEILKPREALPEGQSPLDVSTTFETQTKLKTIPGLYGAGEVTGGVHGKNRLAGNSLLECAVFGRRAGRRAVESVFYESEGKTNNNTSGIPEDQFISLTFREFNSLDQCAYFNLKSTFHIIPKDQALLLRRASSQETVKVNCANLSDGADLGVLKIQITDDLLDLKTLAPGDDSVEFKWIEN